MKRNRSANMSDMKNKQRISSRRREMARFPRFLLILLLVLLLAATAVAAYGYFRPIIVSFPNLSYRYERQANAQYQVQNESSPIMDQTIQGMDMVYLSEYARSVQPVFTYKIDADRIAKFSGHYQIVGILRLRGQSDPSPVIYEKQVPLSDKKEINVTDDELYIEQSAQVSLAEFTALMNDFKQESELQANYELDIGMQVSLTAAYNGSKVLSVQERPSLMMPLGSETFTIKKDIPADQKDNVWMMQRWQLLLTPLPVWVYPVAGGIGIFLLLLVLISTKPRRKLHFNRKVRRMQRKARGRLMLIGDKAWEPEWCITVTNYKTMVKTARKLKHPIFCYVENEQEGPTAYFYVYYGENNYCYTFNGASQKKRKTTTSGSESIKMDGILPGIINEQKTKEQAMNNDLQKSKSLSHPAQNQLRDQDLGQDQDVNVPDSSSDNSQASDQELSTDISENTVDYNDINKSDDEAIL